MQLEELEREFRTTQLAVTMAALMAGEAVEPEHFIDIKLKFDEWLASDPDSDPVDERLILLGLR